MFVDVCSVSGLEKVATDEPSALAERQLALPYRTFNSAPSAFFCPSALCRRLLIARGARIVKSDECSHHFRRSSHGTRAHMLRE